MPQKRKRKKRKLEDGVLESKSDVVDGNAPGTQAHRGASQLLLKLGLAERTDLIL